MIQDACETGSRRKEACKTLGIEIRTLQRWQKETSLDDKRRGPKTSPANKLSEVERTRILEVANSSEYCNQSPSQIVPRLADQEIYIASESTFYRVLKQKNQLNHRQSSRPRTHHRPKELVAIKPNTVWSWDISYLPSNILGKFFYLYLILDIFSRKVVGYEVFEKEASEYAAETVIKAYEDEGVCAGEVTLHSDNGSPMKGSTMLITLQKLGVIPSFSRPSVSNDNPYSESMFRTVKYCPFYPSKPFNSLEESRDWIKKFVDWYNNVHHHSGIKFVTPSERHKGFDKEILEKRMQVYHQARQRTPLRWSRRIRNWEAVGQVYLSPKHSTNKAA